MLTLSSLLSNTLPAAELAAAPQPDARQAVGKSLEFLEKSSAACTDRNVRTCHQVPFTIWASTRPRPRLKVDTAKLMI